MSSFNFSTSFKRFPNKGNSLELLQNGISNDCTEVPLANQRSERTKLDSRANFPRLSKNLKRLFIGERSSYQSPNVSQTSQVDHQRSITTSMHSASVSFQKSKAGVKRRMRVGVTKNTQQPEDNTGHQSLQVSTVPKLQALNTKALNNGIVEDITYCSNLLGPFEESIELNTTDFPSEDEETSSIISVDWEPEANNYVAPSLDAWKPSNLAVTTYVNDVIPLPTSHEVDLVTSLSSIVWADSFSPFIPTATNGAVNTSALIDVVSEDSSSVNDTSREFITNDLCAESDVDTSVGKLLTEQESDFATIFREDRIASLAFTEEEATENLIQVINEAIIEANERKLVPNENSDNIYPNTTRDTSDENIIHSSSVWKDANSAEDIFAKTDIESAESDFISTTNSNGTNIENPISIEKKCIWLNHVEGEKDHSSSNESKSMKDNGAATELENHTAPIHAASVEDTTLQSLTAGPLEIPSLRRPISPPYVSEATSRSVIPNLQLGPIGPLCITPKTTPKTTPKVTGTPETSPRRRPIGPRYISPIATRQSVISPLELRPISPLRINTKATGPPEDSRRSRSIVLPYAGNRITSTIGIRPRRKIMKSLHPLPLNIGRKLSKIDNINLYATKTEKLELKNQKNTLGNSVKSFPQNRIACSPVIRAEGFFAPAAEGPYLNQPETLVTSILLPRIAYSPVAEAETPIISVAEELVSKKKSNSTKNSIPQQSVVRQPSFGSKKFLIPVSEGNQTTKAKECAAETVESIISSINLSFSLQPSVANSANLKAEDCKALKAEQVLPSSLPIQQKRSTRPHLVLRRPVPKGQDFSSKTISLSSTVLVDSIPKHLVDSIPKRPVDTIPKYPVDSVLKRPLDSIPKRPVDSVFKQPVDSVFKHSESNSISSEARSLLFPEIKSYPEILLPATATSASLKYSPGVLEIPFNPINQGRKKHSNHILESKGCNVIKRKIESVLNLEKFKFRTPRPFSIVEADELSLSSEVSLSQFSDLNSSLSTKGFLFPQAKSHQVRPLPAKSPVAASSPASATAPSKAKNVIEDFFTKTPSLKVAPSLTVLQVRFTSAKLTRKNKGDAAKFKGWKRIAAKFLN